VLVGGVAFTLEILGGVDAALRTDRMRTLDRDDREEVNGAAGLGDLDHRRQARQSTAHHNDSGCCHK